MRDSFDRDDIIYFLTFHCYRSEQDCEGNVIWQRSMDCGRKSFAFTDFGLVVHAWHKAYRRGWEWNCDQRMGMESEAPRPFFPCLIRIRPVRSFTNPVHSYSPFSTPNIVASKLTWTIRFNFPSMVEML